MSLEDLVGEVQERQRLLRDVALLAAAMGDEILSRPHLLELLADETLRDIRDAHLREYAGLL